MHNKDMLSFKELGPGAIRWKETGNRDNRLRSPKQLLSHHQDLASLGTLKVKNEVVLRCL